jgi:hypothetical protein
MARSRNQTGLVGSKLSYTSFEYNVLAGDGLRIDHTYCKLKVDIYHLEKELNCTS